MALAVITVIMNIHYVRSLSLDLLSSGNHFSDRRDDSCSDARMHGVFTVIRYLDFLQYISQLNFTKDNFSPKAGLKLK